MTHSSAALTPLFINLARMRAIHSERFVTLLPHADQRRDAPGRRTPPAAAHRCAASDATIQGFVLWATRLMSLLERLVALPR